MDSRFRIIRREEHRGRAKVGTDVNYNLYTLRERYDRICFANKDISAVP